MKRGFHNYIRLIIDYNTFYFKLNAGDYNNSCS